MIEERTCSFVKPGHLNVAEKMINYVSSLLVEEYTKYLIGFRRPTRKQMEEFYSHLRNEKVIFEPMVERLVNDGLFLCVWEGRGIVKRVRTLVGDTDPQKAGLWTIRGKFGVDSLEVAYKERRFLENVFHASENDDAAKRELEIFGL